MNFIIAIITYLFYAIVDPMVKLSGEIIIIEYLMYAIISVFFMKFIFSIVRKEQITYKNIVFISFLVIVVQLIRTLIESRYVMMGLFFMPHILFGSLIYIFIPQLIVGGILYATLWKNN